jgi:hypothetical protein
MAKRETNIVKVVKEEGSCGWVMFLAYVGAVVYFFNLDPTFWGLILALLKAIVWPAFVVYEVLGLLQIK